MLKHCRAFILIGIACFLIASIARAEPTTAAATAVGGSGTISGVVMHDGKPLAQATVRLMKSNRTKGKARKQAAGKAGRRESVSQTATDEMGQFTLADVPPGEYVVIAGIRGQGMGRTTITVGEGQTARVQVQVQSLSARTRRLKGGATTQPGN